MNRTLCICLTSSSIKTLFGFCLQVFRRAEPPQMEDCYAPMENKRQVSFPRTQQRVASWGIEPGFSNLLNTNPMLYHLSDRRRNVQPSGMSSRKAVRTNFIICFGPTANRALVKRFSNKCSIHSVN